ncbi:capsular polysaccharide biosynthesis protein [Burkholderia pseudomallei]|uniref:WcbA n=2 Tax=Burkholderia pseudomallei TaxID=28450 RepID=Q3JP29_BURP1|nr:capsular polysaccharide biosynthesis protein [Burkholderia pseudomallei]ABA48350.1 WcbA [Burkholderia pseudomallei 1710b]AYX07632.1 capsular biosynthesis protein [Burkholderia pseudomallei]EET09664.1 capsular polysaccharide biosynthesis protein [Burkholderia pseudomallei 1710a]MBF3873975.1 capsular biosynthesis protein [Burkholderia pseudomallei]MBF4040637.1 capsular biosynthesis protein [Burkholderia pseudomallei]
MTRSTASRRNWSNTLLHPVRVLCRQRPKRSSDTDREYIWIDRKIGRMALSIAHSCGARTRAAWPGPIWAEVPAGTPLLSWFVVPVTHAGPDAFVQALDAALEQDCTAGTAAAVAELMKRVLASHAIRGRDGVSEFRAPPRLPGETRVLLIDERKYSQGIGAVATRNNRGAFERMIRAARAAHPNAEFWLARTRDRGSGMWLSASAADILPADIHRLGEHESLCAALEHVDHVYTVGASEGMQALLAGRRVHVFGAPYYAGWGLTDDAVQLPGRHARPTLAALFDVVFLRFARYLNPATHAPGRIDDLLDAIEWQNTVRRRFADLRQVAGIRFQWWKRPFATPYLTAGGGTLRWTRDASRLREGEHAALWGARGTNDLPPGTRVIRIEDGFLHSTGLGSDHVAPCSQVIDRSGLYFDPSRPSDLTTILNETDFDDAELVRANRLRREIARLGLTKYNLGRRKPAWSPPPGKRVVLVPGQVADDASIRLGTRGITTAEDLLREVRARRPDAFIVYKPHPDVLSGNRRGAIEVNAWADLIEQDADLISLIEVADEIHTLSSLSGFEALIRGKAVHTYGLPFYAGWGLTQDALAQPWRKRTLSLDMLTAGVLLRYPVYWDWSLRLFASPELVVRQLAIPAARPLTSIRGDRLRPVRKASRWIASCLRHLLWQCGK